MAELGVLVAAIGINVSVLGLVLHQLRESKKPAVKVRDNPGAVDPDDVRLGDLSVGYFQRECLGACREECSKTMGAAVQAGVEAGLAPIVAALQGSQRAG